MAGTAIATRKSTEVSTEVADNPWLSAASDLNEFEGDYLRLNGNTGQFLYGAEENELDAGARMVVNMDAIQHGWICWKNSEVVDRSMRKVMEGSKPSESSLADHGPYEKYEDGTEDGWSEQHLAPMANEEGEKFVYQASNAGSIKALKKFYQEYGKKRGQNLTEAGAYMIPVVELEVGSYIPKEKKRGKKYFPKFNIVAWVDPATVADLFEASEDGGDNAADYEAATPAPAKKKAVNQTPDDPDDTPEKVVTKPKAVAKPAETPVEAEDDDDTDAEAPAPVKAKSNTDAAANLKSRRAKRF